MDEHSFDLKVTVNVMGGAVGTAHVIEQVKLAIEHWRVNNGLSADEDEGVVKGVDVSLL